MANKRWIQKAIKKKDKGKLHREASKHKALTKTGKINLSKMKKVAMKYKKEGKKAKATKLIRQINLAKNLAKLHKR